MREWKFGFWGREGSSVQEGEVIRLCTISGKRERSRLVGRIGETHKEHAALFIDFSDFFVFF